MLRRALLILLVVAIVVLVGTGWVWTRARAAPAWYAPPDPGDAAVVDLAERVEYGLVENFHQIREDDDTWTLRIREQQINAWLAARLPEWIAHQEGAAWPHELGTPQVRVSADGIELAVALRAAGGAQFVVGRLTPRIVDERLELRLDRVGLGQLGLPGPAAGRFLDLLGGVVPAGVVPDGVARQVVRALSGDETLDSAVALADGRRVEMMAVTCADGAIDLTSRTVRAGSGASAP